VGSSRSRQTREAETRAREEAENAGLEGIRPVRCGTNAVDCVGLGLRGRSLASFGEGEETREMRIALGVVAKRMDALLWWIRIMEQNTHV
jgi:hypothetical protein